MSRMVRNVQYFQKYIWANGHRISLLCGKYSPVEDLYHTPHLQLGPIIRYTVLLANYQTHLVQKFVLEW